MSNNTFRYIRFMRDGSVQERTGITNDPKRVRTGKTAKNNKKKGAAN